MKYNHSTALRGCSSDLPGNITVGTMSSVSVYLPVKEKRVLPPRGPLLRGLNVGVWFVGGALIS